jgi:hydrophobe/amphiphile efflux-1 (HAE1) family protein
MNLAEISIRRPVFAWMLMFSILLFGGIAFKRLGVSQLPDVDFPIVNVSVDYEGAAPELVEAEIAEPIESAVLTVEGVKNISTSCRTGSVNVSVEFHLSKDINVAVQEIQAAVSQATRRLPQEIEPPTVRKVNPEDQPIIWFTITSDRLSNRDLNMFVFSRIKDQFATVPGVADVNLGGYVEPALRVWVSEKKLHQYAMTVGDVISAISSEHSELPAGRIEDPVKELNVRTMGEAPSAKEFEKLSINRRGGAPNFTPTPLSAIATVEDGLNDVRRMSRSNGKAAIGIGIRKQRSSNAVDVAHAAKRKMAEVKKQLPEGMEIAINFDTTQFIEESVQELNFTLLISAILTSLVCWMFLGSWSATFNVIFSIPVSVVGSFFVLYLMNFTLNSFTLLALSLAIGIIVDDTIMVLENITRYLEKGKSRWDAAMIGAKEITFAAIAATAAIIAIFLPVAFMTGIIGKYFFQFGITLSVAVAFSLLEALTLTPMRCSQFLQISERTTWLGKGVERMLHGSTALYARTLNGVLNYRWTTLALGILIFAVSLFSAKKIKSEFLPSQDQSRLMVRVQTPVGSSLAYTDTRLKELESRIVQLKELDRYYAAIGGFGGGEVNTAVMFLTFLPPKQRPVDPDLKHRPSQAELGDKIRAMTKDLKDVKISVQDLSLAAFGGRRGFPIEFTVRGPNWDELIASTKKLQAALEDSKHLVDLDSNYRTGMPEIQVFPDRDKARARGVSVFDLNQTVNASIGGVVAGKYTHDGRRYDIRVRLNAEERARKEDIYKLNVRNNRGNLIPLSELVQLKEEPSLQAIYHEDRERAITVFANMAKGTAQAEALDTVERLAKEVLPAGYHVKMAGSSETFKESFRELIFALLLGIVVSYMILASQFNSYIHPVTVLLALPFSLSGALLALFLAGQTINLFSLIGILLLMGIVKKNSILLVEFTNHHRELGLSVTEALKQACPIRFRPIIMTSVSTIVGAVPAALALGPGAEVRIPMGLAVIGGVILSTLLTLIVVPAFYSIVSDSKLSRWLDRRRARNAEKIGNEPQDRVEGRASAK